jgi:hypothetical protein
MYYYHRTIMTCHEGRPTVQGNRVKMSVTKG